MDGESQAEILAARADDLRKRMDTLSVEARKQCEEELERFDVMRRKAAGMQKSDPSLRTLEASMLSSLDKTAEWVKSGSKSESVRDRIAKARFEEEGGAVP